MFVRELVGFSLPVSVAVVAAGVGVGVGVGVGFVGVLCRTSKHMPWNVMIGAKGMKKKYAHNRINGSIFIYIYIYISGKLSWRTGPTG